MENSELSEALAKLRNEVAEEGKVSVKNFEVLVGLMEKLAKRLDEVEATAIAAPDNAIKKIGRDLEGRL